MPASDPVKIAEYEVNDNTASAVLTTTEDVPAGASILVAAATSVTVFGTLGISGVSDASGNTYAPDITGSGGFLVPFSGVIVTLWSAHNVAALPSGSALTVGFSGGNTEGRVVEAWFVRGIRSRYGDGSFPEQSTNQDPGTSPGSDSPNVGSGIPRTATERLALSALAWPGVATLSGLSSHFTGLDPLSVSGIALQPAFLRGTASGTGLLYQDGSTSGVYAGTLSADSAWAGVGVSYPIVPRDVSFDRGPDGRLIVAEVKTDGSLVARLYDDANPPVLTSTVTIDAGPYCRACSLYCDPAGIWYASYTKFSVFVKRSRDQGATWVGGASPLVTLSTGITDLSAFLDKRTALEVLAYYSPGESLWRSWAGEHQTAGLSTSFGVLAQSLVSSARGRGRLFTGKDGAWLFPHRATDDTIRLQECRDLTKDNAGAWASAGDVATGYGAVTGRWGKKSGLHPLALHNGGGGFGQWELSLAEWDGAAWTFTAPVPMGSEPSVWDVGELRELPETGGWEFLQVTEAGDLQLLRNEELRSGSWDLYATL